MWLDSSEHRCRTQRMARETHPHLFMFQELHDDIPKVFEVDLLVRLPCSW